jgi:hypothetical protein
MSKKDIFVVPVCLPQYLYRETIKGAKISEIHDSGFIYFEDSAYPILISNAFREKYNPEVGDYFVVQENQEPAIMTAEVFESRCARMGW